MELIEFEGEYFNPDYITQIGRIEFLYVDGKEVFYGFKIRLLERELEKRYRTVAAHIGIDAIINQAKNECYNKALLAQTDLLQKLGFKQ